MPTKRSSVISRGPVLRVAAGAALAVAFLVSLSRCGGGDAVCVPCNPESTDYFVQCQGGCVDGGGCIGTGVAMNEGVRCYETHTRVVSCKQGSCSGLSQACEDPATAEAICQKTYPRPCRTFTMCGGLIKLCFESGNKPDGTACGDGGACLDGGCP